MRDHGHLRGRDARVLRIIRRNVAAARETVRERALSPDEVENLLVRLDDHSRALADIHERLDRYRRFDLANQRPKTRSQRFGSRHDRSHCVRLLGNMRPWPLVALLRARMLCERSRELARRGANLNARTQELIAQSLRLLAHR